MEPHELGPRAGARTMRQAAARAAGFTLVEVLLATALAAIILAAVAGFAAAARNASSSVRARGDQRARLHGALELIEADLRGLLPPGGIHASGLVGEDATRASGDLADAEAEEEARVEASRLDIEPPPYEARDRVVLTAAPRVGRFGAARPAGAGALPEVTWEIDDDAVTEVRGLVRTVRLVRDPPPGAEEPVAEEVAPFVVGLAIEYFDAETATWVPSWDAAGQEALPPAIRVALAVRGEDGAIRRAETIVAPAAGREVVSLLVAPEGGEGAQPDGEAGEGGENGEGGNGGEGAPGGPGGGFGGPGASGGGR